MLPSTLASLPDSTPCYVPGVGEVTLGEVREAKEKRRVAAEWDIDVAIIRHAVTRNLCRREPWEPPGAGPRGGRE